MNVAENRRVGFDFELLEKLEAGLELRGFEVKAIRAGQMVLAGAHVIIRGGEAYLVGAQIQPYQPNNTPADYDPNRTIRLLLTKKEIDYLTGASAEKGLTIVPLSVYNKGRRLKLSLALAKRKKKHDKREKIKERDVSRDTERTLKQF
jgi:SsrA-binding protein